MAPTTPSADPAPATEIAEQHRSTVDGILRAAGHGLLTTAEADLLIRRIRDHHGTAFTERGDTVADGRSTGDGHTGPDRTSG